MDFVDWLIVAAIGWLLAAVVVTAAVGKATAAAHDYTLWDLELTRDDGDVSCP